MDKKKCSTCRKVKFYHEFNKKSSNRDGLERYCKLCHRKRNQKHYQSNKESYKLAARKYKDNLKKWFASYKSTLMCEECGETKHWRLCFHHPDPSQKEFNVSEMITNNISRERIIEEIKKCVVLCQNCHSDVHYYENKGCPSAR